MSMLNDGGHTHLFRIPHWVCTPSIRRRAASIAGRPHTGGSVCYYRASRFDGENDGFGCEVDHDTAHQCKKGRFLFTMSLQCRMLNMPARGAIIAELVERDDLMNAVALHTMVNQTGLTIGPAAAGGIIELVGIGPTLLVNSGLYVVGIPLLLMISGLPPGLTSSGGVAGMYRSPTSQPFQCARRTCW